MSKISWLPSKFAADVSLLYIVVHYVHFQVGLTLRAEEALEKSLKIEIDAMAKDAERLEGLVSRAQAAVDKRQNVIELRQQQLAELGERNKTIVLLYFS